MPAVQGTFESPGNAYVLRRPQSLELGNIAGQWLPVAIATRSVSAPRRDVMLPRSRRLYPILVQSSFMPPISSRERESDPRSLATATINRLLRPLRTRCNVLAKMVSTQSRPSAKAYSSSRGTNPADAPNHELPLVVYPPPDKYASRAYFSQGYKDSLELIRRIYAVRDAFRNVVTKIGLPAQRVPALSSLCAAVIGRNMQSWEEPPGEDGDDDDQSDAAEFVDQMYETVPAYCRGWLVTSHALGVILNSCPHHLTLISILLDEVLTHRLQNEAVQLVEALLLVALRPKPNGPAPITHPAHAKFLTEWLDRWPSAGFSIQTFTKVLTEVLSDVQSTDVWTSRAIEQVTRRLFHLDISSCILLTTELAVYAASKARPRRLSTGTTADDISEISKQLCQWNNSLFELYSLNGRDLSQTAGVHDALFDLIKSQRIILLSETDARLLDLKDSIINLSLVWFVHNRETVPPSYLQTIETLLASTAPRPATYRSVVKHLFSNTSLDEGRKRLRPYTSTLRRQRLSKHEASIWGSTLYMVENMEGDAQLSPEARAEVRAYRQEVMELVDEAESKLFEPPARGLRGHDYPESSTTTEKNFGAVSRSPWLKGGWEWEPVIGCWVRRRMLEPSSPTALAARKKQRMALVTPMKKFRRPSDDTWPTVSRSAMYRHDQQTESASGKIPSLFSTCRNFTFTSLVANAVSQRTVLHPVQLNRHREEAPDNDALDFLEGSESVEGAQKEQKKRRLSCEAHQPSDDILDLLASPFT